MQEILFDYDLCAKCKRLEKEAGNRDIWKFMGIPGRVLDATFDNFEASEEWQTKAVTECRLFANARRGFLVLTGKTGTGKDHLSAATSKQFNRFVYSTQVKLLRRLRQTYSEHTTDAFIEQLAETPLLVLSEVGLSAGGGDEEAFLYEVLSERYEREKPTVLNSNFSLALGDAPAQELNRRLGQRLVSRIKGSLFALVELEGQDYRPKLRNHYFSTKGKK